MSIRHFSPISGLWVLLLGGLLLFGCGSEPPEGDLCAQECAANQVCSDGACVCPMGRLDCDGDPANGCEHLGASCPVDCVPEEDRALCQRSGKECGELSREDNCGSMRVALCGPCGEGSECEENLCVPSCEPEDDQAFCERLGKSCGEVVADDLCGNERTLSCGGCGDGSCVDGACIPACEPIGEATLCERFGKRCGEVAGDDGCGAALVASCGECDQGHECDEGICRCEGEPEEELCAALGKNCGTLLTTDRCGDDREVDCGSCGAGEPCGAEVENVCGPCVPVDDETFCEQLGADCGTLTRADGCGQVRTLDCGTCEGEESCGANRPNVCGIPCVPEEDEALCSQLGATCGSPVIVDGCGTTRQPDCGSCPFGETCGSANTCVAATGGQVDAACNTSAPCMQGLICVTDGWGDAVCKQPCSTDPDCQTGTCIPDRPVLGTSTGICGNAVPAGGSCTYWLNGSNLCWDASSPSGTWLECVRGTCDYVCMSTLVQTPAPCPSGLSCSGDVVFDFESFLDYNVCE